MSLVALSFDDLTITRIVNDDDSEFIRVFVPRTEETIELNPEEWACLFDATRAIRGMNEAADRRHDQQQVIVLPQMQMPQTEPAPDEKGPYL
jgi:hypothetical protein